MRWERYFLSKCSNFLDHLIHSNTLWMFLLKGSKNIIKLVLKVWCLIGGNYNNIYLEPLMDLKQRHGYSEILTPLRLLFTWNFNLFGSQNSCVYTIKSWSFLYICFSLFNIFNRKIKLILYKSTFYIE